MVFLLVYAVAVWAVVVIHRRRWPAFLAIFAGLPPIVIIAAACAKFLIGAEKGDPRIIVYLLAGALMALIVYVGLVIAVQPRRVAALPCGGCGYDVVGNTSGACPECGADLSLPARLQRRARTPRTLLLPGPAPEHSLAGRLAQSGAWRARADAEIEARLADPPGALPAPNR